MLVGIEQILSVGQFSLTLDLDDFDANFADGVGYQRVRRQMPEIDYNLLSTPVIRSPMFTTYEFQWSLVVEDQKAYLLEALIDESLRLTQNGDEPAIRLLDIRLPLTESVPRRARVGDMLGPYTYWPQFNILITEFTPQWFTEKYTRIDMRATELDKV